VLICAEDGWVEDWTREIPRRWNFRGCKKYQSATIFCLTPEEQLKIAKPVLPHLSWFKSLIWSLFNTTKTIKVEFLVSNLNPVATFKEQLIRAVQADDDILAQHQEERALIDNISRADSYADLYKIYLDNGWV
jgi:hypothetical protein